MEFGVWTKGLATLSVDCLVLGVFEEAQLGAQGASVDAASDGRLRKLLARGDFSGRAGETLLVSDLPGITAAHVLLTGMGSAKQLQRRSWRKAWSTAANALLRTRIASCAVALDRPDARELDDYYLGRAVAELTGAALYRINDLKTARKPPPAALKKVLAGPVRRAAATERGLAHGDAVAAAQTVQRDLANLPANICTPTYLAEEARALAKRHASLRVRVLDEAAIRREKMGCLLAVAQGSHQPPRFIVLEHQIAKKSRPPIVLVGKGVTFDSGGISLKDPPGMDEMKFDMSGAAAVIAALTLAAQLRLPLHLIGLVAAVENMPGGRAVKPGDIVTSASGQTVEILNTDAEGRLILADALSLAAEEEPDLLLDFATLTGAARVALGPDLPPFYTEDETLAAELARCAGNENDPLWRLPLWRPYQSMLDSKVADLNNVSSGGFAGSIAAALFLKRF
ncbi:MAG: leucyl aminopeptidase, partial [Sinobacteraceae bacterium]|nr:leucyl aminopeptidase [Nevskiaceae bacterium]